MTKDEALNQLREVHAIQGRDGCWDIDDYMLGLYNGLELALSIVENRECRYKNRPKPQRTWVGLTDEEIETLIHRFDGDPHTLLDEVNARLKETNNG